MKTVTISSAIYERAEEYARRNDISLSELVEKSLSTLLKGERKKGHVVKDCEELSPGVRSLIGVADGSLLAEDDVNGREARCEYLMGKYDESLR